jgi:flagellar hook protein FlgE
MTGAMSSAIAGLKAHMDKLNVIGNNIANVNTWGFKPSRVSFQDSLYTTSSAGSNGTATVGSRNPSQIGYGTSIGSIDLDMSTGTYTATGWGLDTMIQGDGFFLVGDKTTGSYIDPTDPETLKSLTLTRVGDFSFGADGYLVDGRGNVVYGFMSVQVQAQDENGDPMEDEDGNPIYTTQICDQLVPIRYPLQDAEGNVKWPTFGEDGRLQDAVAGADEQAYTKASIDGVSIDENTGKIVATVAGSDQPVTIGYLAIGKVTNPNGVTHTNGYYYKAQEGAGDLTITSIGNAVADEGVTYVNGSLLMGEDNDWANLTPEELENLDTVPPTGMQVEHAGGTVLNTGGLEGSKTDLATEISEMITTQRGYQANTRIITVTDTMLEELVNMKR